MSTYHISCFLSREKKKKKRHVTKPLSKETPRLPRRPADLVRLNLHSWTPARWCACHLVYCPISLSIFLSLSLPPLSPSIPGGCDAVWPLALVTRVIHSAGLSWRGVMAPAWLTRQEAYQPTSLITWEVGKSETEQGRLSMSVSLSLTLSLSLLCVCVCVRERERRREKERDREKER